MQNPCYTIRKAREEDVVGIGKMHYNGWIDTYSDLLPQAMIASLSEERSIRIFQREGCRNMYVATVNGDVVAFAATECGAAPGPKSRLSGKAKSSAFMS